MKVVDLTGQRFGRLVVLKRIGSKHRSALWLCKCDCGKTKEATSSGLKCGHVQSCGCLSREIHSAQLAKLGHSRAIHGEYKSKLHNVWGGMIQRCTNPKHQYYALYGGRGIQVCKEWRSYVAFRDWAVSHGYKEGLTIDRIDSNGDYCPSNCRLVTMREQQLNRRNNVRFVYDGETLTMSQLIERYNLKHSAYYHYQKGKSIAEIIQKCAR